MILYSETVITFLKRVRQLSRQIMSEELGLIVFRERVDYFGRQFYLKIVVFEHPHKLGYFDSDRIEIGLNKTLMYSAKKDILKDIIRHELAHFMTYILYGHCGQKHGPQFLNTCRQYYKNFSEIQKATIDLASSNDLLEGDIPTERIINKVKKLLALAKSANLHESKLATAKANQLLLRYNLEQLATESDDGEIFVHRLLTVPRLNAKLHALYEVLSTYGVSPVYSYNKDGVTFEVTGPKANVLIAEHVALFLYSEFDLLWAKAKRDNPSLKGLKAKNSFVEGVANGYVEKIRQAKKTFEKTNGKELLRLEKDLEQKFRLAYPRLGQSSSKAGLDPESHMIGKIYGKDLSIQRPITSTKSSVLLID